MTTGDLKIDKHDTSQLEDIFHYVSTYNNCEILMHKNKHLDLHAFIALHSTINGPALGGCRFIEYESPYAGMVDAMRLARAMSYKSALLGIPFGGGKAVILKPKSLEDRKAFFESVGEFVHSLNGRYITAVDSGTKMEDMDVIATKTPYVTSNSNMNGSPSPYTALGVFSGIKAAVKSVFQRNTLDGLKVAIQGVGEVGQALIKYLAEEGAEVSVADINSAHIEQAKSIARVEVLPVEAIHAANVDIYAPCALGGSLNEQTISQIKAKIVAGAANNQLQKPGDGMLLHQNQILYAPDYVINAGGLIYAAGRYQGHEKAQLEKTVHHIYDTLTEIFDRYRKEQIPTSIIAETMAGEKLYGKL